MPYRDQPQAPRREEKQADFVPAFKQEIKPAMPRQEMPQPAPTMQPPVKPATQTEPVKIIQPNVVPAKKPFSNLKDLLHKLEDGEKLARQTGGEKVNVVPQAAEIPEKPKTASLSSLRRPIESKKSPSAHNMSALKDVLSQALKEREEIPEIPKKQPLDSARSEEIKNPEIKEEKKDIPASPAAERPREAKSFQQVQDKPKEIPEDVLRKILE